MKLLDRYIIRQLAWNLLLIVAALASLYLLVDIFERLDGFQEHHLPALLAMRYFLLKLPMIFDQIGPVGLLLSGIITMGLLMNRRELQSLNAAGIPTLRVLLPFGIGAVVCTVVGLAVAQWLLPASGLEVNRIWDQQVMGESETGTVRNGVTFFRGREGIYTFRSHDRDHTVLSEFRYQEFGTTEGKGLKLYAKRATYRAGTWQLEEGQTRTERPEVKVEPFSHTTLSLPDEEAEFFSPVALDFEHPLSDLVHRALDRTQSGQRQAVLDLNRRLSFLLMGLPLLCLALPLLLRFGVGRTTAINLAFAIPVSAGLAFLVWGVWSGLQAMAQTAVIPAVAASWSIHLLCLAGGAILMGWRR